MNQDIPSLVNGYLDETLSEAQLRELEAWINADPDHARQFAKAVHLDNSLQAALALEQIAKVEVAEAATIRARRKSRLNIAMVVAIAASLIVVMGFATWVLRQDDSSLAAVPGGIPGTNAIGTVIQVVDADWGTEKNLKSGDRLSPGTIRLNAGIVHMTLDNGVDVTLEGPVEYELSSMTHTRLVTGLLSAVVPQGAEGFRVDTPSAQVIDLGTAFGIEQINQGSSRVLVFDGEVEVIAQLDRQSRQLTEGEAVRLDSDGSISDVAFETEAFERLWPTASGIAGSSDIFRFVPPWPKRFRFIESNEHVFVAPEGYAVRLRGPLQLNISEPGEYTSTNQLTPLGVATGERVRSYVLHYSPTEEVPRRFAKRIKGSITFDRPVVGLIVGHDELLASSRRFSRRPAGESHPRRQLELLGDGIGDKIELSEDRRTVTIDFQSPRRSSDLVRVIVDHN